jgi:putative peptidoglycan lipid II flippase
MTSPVPGDGGTEPDGDGGDVTGGRDVPVVGASAAASADAATLADPGAVPARGGLGRSSMIMASGTAASRVLGVVNTALLGWAIGLTGSIADAFSVANKLPNTLYLLIAGGVLNAVLVPQVVRAYRRADGQQYVDRLLTVGIAALAGLTLVLTATAPFWVRFYSQFVDPRATTIAIALAFWCIPQVFFYGLYSLLGQVLNARGSFGPYMWAPVVNNIVFIAGLLVLVRVHGQVDEHTPLSAWTSGQTAVLGAAATVGIVAQAFILLVPLYRSGFRYRPRWGLRGSGLGSAGRVATWTFLGLLIGQVGVWRISVVASSVGSVGAAGNAIYDRAFLIFMLPHSLVTVSLATALFTRLSGRAAADDAAGVRADFSLGVRTVGVFTVLATTGIAVLAFPLGRAMFPSQSDTAVHALATVVVPLVLGLVPFGIWSLCQRVYYAYEDARAMVPVQVVMAVIVVGGTEAGRWLLDDRYWVAAACASMALSYAVGAGIALVAVRRRLRGVDGPRVLALHLKAVAGAVAAAVAGLGLLALLGPVQDLRQAVVACVLGAVVMTGVYVGVLALLRVGELGVLLRPVLRLVRRGRPAR